MATDLKRTSSFEAGVLAARNGSNINNSYPHIHSEFVKGYKSVNAKVEEDLALKSLWNKYLPEEYKD